MDGWIGDHGATAHSNLGNALRSSFRLAAVAAWDGVLGGMVGEHYDLIYIDGSHEAADVLADAVLTWPLLRPGGLVGFDDYEWPMCSEEERRPTAAVNAFLTCMKGKFEEVHRGYPLWVRKVL
ncbi:MAG TPA: class I SAM-dependent methyltransferase [Gemmata sp.]|nr:class I SAM-dependent methyltransferase [Gemmata sp.]